MKEYRSRKHRQPLKIKVTAWKCRRCGAFFAEDEWIANEAKGVMEIGRSAFMRACDHEHKCIGTLQEMADGSWRELVEAPDATA